MKVLWHVLNQDTGSWSNNSNLLQALSGALQVTEDEYSLSDRTLEGAMRERITVYLMINAYPNASFSVSKDDGLPFWNEEDNGVIIPCCLGDESKFRHGPFRTLKAQSCGSLQTSYPNDLEATHKWFPPNVWELQLRKLLALLITEQI